MTKFLTKAMLAATVATGLFASPALAADTKPFTATARIVSPLLLELKNGGLDFGTITKVSATAGGDVRVGRAGGGSNSCDANLLCTGTRAPAQFEVSGSLGQGVSISLESVATLKHASLADTVAFASDAPAAATLGAAGTATPGKATFEIGGVITVAANTPDGVYSDEIDVTVEYN